MNINIEEYLKLYRESMDELKYITPFFKGLVGFYINLYKKSLEENEYAEYSQKENYVIEGLGNNFYTDINVYKDYGIYDSILFNIDRKYLFIVFPEKSIEENIEIFTRSVPNNSIPTGLAVLSSDTTVIEYWKSEIKRSYPSISDYFNIKNDAEITKSAEELCKQLNISKEKVLDIGIFLRKLEKIRKWDKTFLKAFSDTIDEVNEKAKRENKILLNSYMDSELCFSFYTEMFLRYRRGIYCTRNNLRNMAKKIMEPIRDPDCCSVYELWQYVHYMPKYMIRLIDQYSDPCVAIVSPNRVFCFNAKFIPLNSDNARPKEKFISIGEDYYLLNPYNEWDLDTKEGCNEFKEVIMKLYDTLQIPDDIVLSITNVVLFSNKSGSKFIGYAYNIDYKCTVKYTNMHFLDEKRKPILLEEEFSSSDMNNLFYPFIFIDGIAYLRKVIPSYNPKKELSCLSNIRKFNNKYNGIFYYHTFYNVMLSDENLDNKDIYLEDVPFSSYALNSAFMRNLRVVLRSDVEASKMFKLMSTKLKREQLDCFGGMTKALGDGSFQIRR